MACAVLAKTQAHRVATDVQFCGRRFNLQGQLHIEKQARHFRKARYAAHTVSTDLIRGKQSRLRALQRKKATAQIDVMKRSIATYLDR